jgi:hypothetical protein
MARSTHNSSTSQGGRSDSDDGSSGEGPLVKDLHQTSKGIWAAVILMCLGAAVVGVGVVVLSMDVTTAVVVLIVGAVIGLAGIAMSVATNIMSNVE